ncbi:MAG: hypothetical protein Q9181_003535 [Wetmoreana brouardii]
MKISSLQSLFTLSSFASAWPTALESRALPPDQLRRVLLRSNLLAKAQTLEGFAYSNPERNRVFGGPGHNATVNYLYDQIAALSSYYDVEYQPFVELYTAGNATVSVNGADQAAQLFTYSPSGKFTESLVVVANLGCNASDYPALSGKIALISRGSCEFGLKSALAGAAGADAAIIYDNINETSFAGTLGAPPRPEGPYVPTAGISQVNGLALKNAIGGGATVTADVNIVSVMENRTTYNVIAQTKGGDPDNVLVLTAHTDSVEAGPGINDNGSGTIGILEVALQLAKFSVNNAIRFVWVSAEEFGLLGSKYYVSTLSAAQKSQIRLNLNFDMIASPNYKYGIYDGDGSTFNVTGAPGSAEAEKLFQDYFTNEAHLAYVPDKFDGRSDYAPFADAGIAAGGLFTGAEGIKTAEEQQLFGGQAGVAYDVNYHGAGDNVQNLNLDAFLQNAKAIAHAVAVYGRSFETLPLRDEGLRRRREVGRKGQEIRGKGRFDRFWSSEGGVLELIRRLAVDHPRVGITSMPPAEALHLIVLTRPPPKPVIHPVENDSYIPFLFLESIMSDALNQALQDLKSKNEEVRTKAAHDVYAGVVAAAREQAPEAFQATYSLVNHRLSQLINGSDPYERIGGILAVEQLINFDGDDPAQKTTRFAGYLKSGLRANDNNVLIYAARALGRLAVPGGALTAELVESEVKSALEWLQIDRQENRRFAAVLVIRDLARSSPTLLYAFVPQVLDCIWVAVRDQKVLIRETAAEAVGACFDIILTRDTGLRDLWHGRMYDETLQGFKSSSIEYTHGSLLILRELLQKGGMFMRDRRYRDACEIILRLKDHKEPRIRSQVVSTIPLLAVYSPMEFAQNYLHKFMIYLQGQLKKDKERNTALIAIGKIAHAVTSAIAPYLDGIIVFVREALSVKARNRVGIDEAPVFQCISMLAIAVGQTLSKYMEALMDPMFACGLSQSLTQALVDMAHYIPPIKPMIQDKLLDLLSIVLCGRPFKPLGCPDSKTPPIPAFAKDYNMSLADHKDSEIALALDTLGSFDFRGHQLNEFVRDVAIRYVENNNPRIRKAAALTCCQIYTQDPIIRQTSSHAIRTVAQVVEKLLVLGVADPVPDIRKTVLRSLDSKFNQQLATPGNIRSAFLAINDTDLEVREAAITIIGRLTEINPAFIFPPLRKLLVNLMSGIKSSKDPKFEEDAARLISIFIANCSRIVKPYVSPLVNTLLPNTTAPNVAVASTSIKAIGELATVGGADVVQYISTLMPIIIGALQDLSSTTKRDAALHTLGQLASSSGYVIQPYLDYPHLLDLLINIIKSEPQGSLRKETIKLLGTLGALDPYKNQQIMETSPEVRLRKESQAVSDVALIMQGLTPNSEEYYPTVVFNTLLQHMLKDASLSQYHTGVIDAIVTTFKTLGLKCVPFLGQIVPSFVAVVRSAPQNRLESYFNQIMILVKIVKKHIRPYGAALIGLVYDFFSTTVQIQYTVLSLVEALSRSLEHEFAGYIPKILPIMLDVFEKDTTNRRIQSEKVLHTILVIGPSAEFFMHLIIPSLTQLFQNQTHPVSIRKSAIDTIGKISRNVNISDYASTIILNLVDILGAPQQVLRQAALDCISAYIFQLGQDFLCYSITVKKALVASHLSHHNYDVLVSKLQKGEDLPENLSPDENYSAPRDDSTLTDAVQKKLPVNQEHLKAAFEASGKSTHEDWLEWMRRFSVELLKESPSHALRACANLAGVYQPLAKDLFNAAFISCWTELFEGYQDDLIKSLENAITSPNIPPEILQVLLNLAEFMEHDDKALPIDIRVLGAHAAKCHAFAKALHYKELEFEEEKTPSTVEALISINNQLQQSDAAVGILRNAQKYRDFDLKETWFEKLQRWDEALSAYQRREMEDPRSFEVTMGKMRCLHALGEWEILSDLAQQKWSLSSIDHKRAIAPLAAAAAWGQKKWELMDNYIHEMKGQSPDRSFFSAILAIQRNQFVDAYGHIEKAREGLDTELSALLGESYDRAYQVVVRVQMLAELEEIIAYKKSEGDLEKQAGMRQTWTTRLKGCQRNVEVWQRMLKVRALVVSPKENVEMWIKFANLCRKSGRIGLAEKSLQSLHKSNVEPNANALIGTSGVPEILYAMLKYQWSSGPHQHQTALDRLQAFTAELAYQLSGHEEQMRELSLSRNPGRAMMEQPLTELGNPPVARPPLVDTTAIRTLLAKCYLKAGEWMTVLKKGDWSLDHVHDIIDAYENATKNNKTWYKAWHAWALANFEVVTAITSQANRETAALPQDTIQDHVVPAVQGFFQSIALSSNSALQDTLRLLTLWFAHGGEAQVNLAVTEGFNSVSVDTWLEVIPQLIARINQPNTVVRKSIHQLLKEVGKAHPQALVYPLTVAMKSNVTRRSASAGEIMENMKTHSPNLVEQADLVSQELIRVAVLWHELWHEGLEEASRLYFGDNDIEGMFNTLEPLHDLVDKGADTLREISFVQAFGRDLHEARDWCVAFRNSNEIGDLNQAWDLYYSVFRRIARQLPHLMQLELTFVSPKLKEVKNLELAVPGTYQSGKPVVRIMEFEPIFNVIPSKQRPRKMALVGSDGALYTFVLKGHEDIRQDERVMQLFGLVNTLLNGDSESFKRHLNIQRFPAIPLSQSSGLLGWVPNSDTLHNLIKDYRENRRILLNIEHRIMLQMAPDYDNLTLMQKVEVFSYAMDNTTGKDLYRVLWLKSKSSESWLQRRTNYTRSLAVMSMVGYILGLGDRHPSNLMLDRITGKIIHIDFGDCFEVAMHREKYPERVPFRLTRMLTFAMEVSNIDGSFKLSSEAVMRVIRDNKESLMAVLEAFIHDPLLNWRLGNRESPPEPSFPSERRQSIVGELEQAQQQRLSNGGSYRARRISALTEGDVDPQRADENREVQNARAIQVLARVKEKLTGRDFKKDEELNVEDQVQKLIRQATSVENLCQHYIGWCSFW